MKKWLVIMLAALIGSAAYGETDARARKILNDIQKGVLNGNTILKLRVVKDGTVHQDFYVGQTLTVTGAVTFSSTLGVTGTLTASGDFVAEGDVTLGNAPTDQLTYVLVTNNISTNGILLTGGLIDVGGGTYSTADGDNDLGIAGDLEVDGAVIGASGTFTDVGVHRITITGDSLTLTNLGTMTPVRSRVVFSNTDAGTITNSLGACADNLSGGPVYFVNGGTNTVVILNTGIATLSGNLTLGPQDTFWGIYRTTNNFEMYGTVNNVP